MLQTIHKLYIKPYIEPYTASVQNYTRSGTQTLHFVFEHESREWNLERESREWSEWSESYVTFVTNVTNVSNVSNVRNVKQEMAIGGDATRRVTPANNKKIQQF